MNENLQKVKDIFRSPALRAIASWSKPVGRSVALIAALEGFSALLSLGITLTIRDLIDGATSGRVSALWKYGAILVALMVTARLLSVWVSYRKARASAGFQMELQRMVMTSIMGKEYSALKAFHSGELVSRLFSDVSVVKNGVLSLVPAFLNTAVSFIGATVILVMMDWRFIPLLLLCTIAGTILTLIFRNPLKQRHKRMQEASAALHASTQENLGNIHLIKASVSEKRVLEHMESQRRHLVEEQLRNSRLSIAMNNGMGSLFDVSRLLCYLWGCFRIFQGSLTYGSLVALTQLIGRIQYPVANAVTMVSQAYGMIASAERLLEVIGLPNETVTPSLDSFDEVRLESVCFHYEDGPEKVLQDVNITIRRGDSVAMTGISGAGKTSLFQLLLGMYHPTSGSVSFVSERQSVPAGRGTRSLFAYVPQGNTLMSGTLKDNLTLFTDGASEEEIRAAVHAACLDDLVHEIGMDARLGERGIGLSEGQAQRVALARALLSRAPILLLDEATSALDEATEAQVLQNISEMRDKTVIIVTHRSAALAICDYTLRIDDGKVTR